MEFENGFWNMDFLIRLFVNNICVMLTLNVANKKMSSFYRSLLSFHFIKFFLERINPYAYSIFENV